MAPIIAQNTANIEVSNMQDINFLNSGAYSFSLDNILFRPYTHRSDTYKRGEVSNPLGVSLEAQT
jgi:hypothetical protein